MFALDDSRNLILFHGKKMQNAHLSIWPRFAVHENHNKEVSTVTFRVDTVGFLIERNSGILPIVHFILIVRTHWLKSNLSESQSCPVTS